MADEERALRGGSDDEEFEFRVRTTDNELHTVVAHPDMRCSELKTLIQERSGKQGFAVRLIYQGRMLADSETVEGCGVGAGHTLHAVFQPPAPEPSPTIVSPHTSHHSRTQLDHEGPLDPQPHSHRSSGRGPGGSRYVSDFRAYMPLRDPMLQFDDAAVLQREYGNAEVLAGMVLGFLLGFLAAFCLIDSNVSRLMKMGIIIGLFTNFSLTWMRIAMGETMHGYQDNPYEASYGEDPIHA